jgi:sulfide:quinone oxidoreductase
MSEIRHIVPHFAVTGALRPDDIRAAAALGFKAIISNLPDGESGAPLSSTEEGRLAAEAGLAFRYIPANKFEVFGDRVVDGMIAALGEFEGPVLGHCASGARTALAWAGAAARHQSPDCILATLAKAGFDLSAVRDELQEQHQKPLAGPLVPALDCACDTEDEGTV